MVKSWGLLFYFAPESPFAVSSPDTFFFFLLLEDERRQRGRESLRDGGRVAKVG